MAFTEFAAGSASVIFGWRKGILARVQSSMRRRSRRAPNTSESTGKIGQEIPSNQPAPLVPYYPDDAPRRSEPARESTHQDSRQGARQSSQQGSHAGGERRQQPREQVRQPRPEQSRPDWDDQAGSGRLEVETQPELPPTPAPRPNAAGQAPKGCVVLAIGLPGSGKTTWFGRRGITPLSSDLLRNILFDDVEEQRYQGLVFSTLRSLLRARLIARMPMNYVDATNLSIHERRQWIKMAKSFGYEVQAVFFDVPLEVCLERNRQRDRSVSEDVMRKMAERLKPPVFEEGFEKITVVRVKSA
jgi:predicted kinase